MMEQGNLHNASERKVFYVYGVPQDQQSSAKVENVFRQNGVKDFSVDGNKVRVVVHGKESIKTMREKFSRVEGHDLRIMPEVLKDVHVKVDKEWIEVIDQSCPNFETILQGIDVKVSKTSEGVFLIGSLEGVKMASEIITEKVDAEILKTKSSISRKMNGHGFHNSENGILRGSELATVSSARDSEVATGSLANCHRNVTTVEKRLKDGSNELEQLAASSTNTNGMAEMITADQRVGANDHAISNSRFNGSMADACTVSLEDYQLEFVKRFYPDLYEPLIKHPTLDISVRSKTYTYFSDLVKVTDIDRLKKVTENPNSVISEFLRRSNVLKRLTTKSGGKLKLLVSDPSQGNTVEIIGFPEDIDMLRKEIDKGREALIRKTQRECLSLNEQQIKFITNCYPKIFESMDEQFLLVKESDGVTSILGTPDDVDRLHTWIKKRKIDHLQWTEQRMPIDIDENTYKVLLSSLPSEVKIHLEFLLSGKIMIVGSKEDIESFHRMLRIKSDETMNVGSKNVEQTSSANGAVGPVGLMGMTAVDHKSNESVESTSSGTDGGKMEASSKTIHLKDFQWQFTKRFHSDLHKHLTDYLEQNHETKKKLYTHMLDMIKDNNIDRVEKKIENAKHVETRVLQRLAAKLPTNLKVIVAFPSDDGVVEIIGLPEDAEKWWILLRKEIDACKSHLSKKVPQASHAIQTYELKFIKTFYSEVYEYIEGLHVQNKSEKEILYAGTFDELDKLKTWIRNHDIDRLESKIETMANFIDKEDCKEVHGSKQVQIKLYLSFPVHTMYEIIGFKDDIRSFKDKLKQREEVNRKKFLANSAQTASSSRTGSDSSHVHGITSSSDREFVFKTPLSSIQVTIARGDLTKQTTEAIVNPCNELLRHMGGAAKAIADAAGSDLLEDCKKYIKKNRLLQTSEVMHSRSGRLNPQIKHVIHACGPVAKEYPDSRKCQDVLEKTFFNCFAYANNELHIDSLSVPAISSGTFGVPKDVVAQSTWNALMRFDDQMSKTAKTKCLKVICFVNIDQESTNSLIQTFKRHWNMYLLDQKSKVEAAQSEGSRKSSSRLRRSGSVSEARGRNSVKDPKRVSGNTEKVRTSVSKTQNHDSDESKSVRGTTLQGVPQIKSGSAVKSSASESKYCCVCMRRKISSQVTRSNCPHKCCESCKYGQCQQCTRSTKIDSGPPSTRALVQSPTGGKKENDTERPESPETMFSGNAKTTRTTRRQRSLSVGYSLDRATDVSDIDQREERSENRAMSAAAASITNSQQHQQDDDCCICMDKIDDPKKLGCGHVFCKDCIDEAFKHQPKCPSCSQIFGMLKGNQPKGKMTVKKETSLYLEGYRGCGAIVITYDIPDGIQTADHPNPGQKFHGTFRTAYLPGNAEGDEVCDLLQKAFDAKLIFTVGKSNTTGRDNVVIWNDIHHKTSTGGQYGYPDPTYLQRVTDELGAKGIKSDTARTASSVDRHDTNSADKPGSATGGYDVSANSHWNDSRDYASLPITRAHASPTVHSRDIGAPSVISSIDKLLNSTAGSATGGYGVSASSHWDDNRDYTSLPTTRAHASPNVYSRDFDAHMSLLTTTGMGSSSPYPFSDLPGVHTPSSRSSRALSPVNSSSSLLSRSQFPLSSGSEWSTTRYNEPSRTSLSLYSTTASSISSPSSVYSTSGYYLRSLSSTSSSATRHQPSSARK